MAQNIVADDMLEPLAERVESCQKGFSRGIHNQARRLGILCHRSKGKDPRLIRINLEVYRNAALQKSGRIFFRIGIHTQDAR